MKRVLVFAYTVFLTGLVLKLFHVHYNAVVMLAALVVLLVTYIISLFLKTKEVSGVTGLAIVFWLILILFSVKFLPFVNVILFAAVVLSIIALLKAANKGKFKRLYGVAFSLMLALSAYLSPTDVRYYILNIKWSYEIESDFFSWDKYSWFLYQNNKFDAAIEASNKAKEIALLSNDAYWEKAIASHTEKIRSKNWHTFNQR